MTDPGVAAQIENWRVEADELLAKVRSVADRLHAVLPALTISTAWMPQSDTEIRTGIAEGFTPGDLIGITISGDFTLEGADWLAEVLEAGTARR
jgi:hypothetical protein